MKIDLIELDKIEKNHPKDIDRQKTEVIKYWLCNSPDALWTMLANAVERIGHGNVVMALRENKQSSEWSPNPIYSQQHSFYYPELESPLPVPIAAL